MENTKVSIELTVAEWNYVMQVLGNMPFGQVAGLIGVIRQQAEAQLSGLQMNSDENTVIDSAAA